MSRKTLKQKLKSQLKVANSTLNEAITTQHTLAGLTINFEVQKMQSIGMAHGVMGTLITVKNTLTEAGVDITIDPAYLDIEKKSQIRIAQCVMALESMGLSMDEINAHIAQGH